MDQAEIERLIQCLNSPSSKLVDVLIRIRTHVIKTNEGVRTFRECGGLKSMVPLLRKTNERILDIVLSTLGNCCMEEESCIELGKLIPSSALLHILKCINRDSIVGRACRLIGNLAQQPSNAEQLHKDKAVDALLAVILDTKKSTTQTIIMAVRALRLLWMVTERRNEMLSSGAVRAVAILLTTECENAELITPLYCEESKKITKPISHKDRSELFAGLLKCLEFFTTLTTFECAEQIQGDGRGYRCLVILIKDYQSSALKCIINLCHVATSRPVLGNAGAIHCVVQLLESQTPNWPDQWVQTLCMLCRESVNRAKVRQCGGLQMLVAVTQDTTNMPRHMDALKALLLFVFDDISFQMLIKHGLVPVIGAQFKEYTDGMSCDHEATGQGVITADKTKESQAKEKSTPNLSESNKNNRRVVIERDNMMINFNDAYDTEGSSDSDSGTIFYKNKIPYKGPSLNNRMDLEKIGKYDWTPGLLKNQPNEIEYTPSPNVSPLSGYSSSHSGSSIQLTTKLKYVDLLTGFRTMGYSVVSSSPESPEGSGSSPSYLNSDQWSPGSSQGFCVSPRSEANFDEESSDSEKSGCYSPVCSDVEETAQNQSPEKLAEFSATLMNDMDKLLMEDDQLLEADLKIEDTTVQNIRYQRRLCLLALLSRISHSEIGLEKLATQEILDSLIVYLSRSKRPHNRAASIISRLTGNAFLLVKIIESRLILDLHKFLHQPRHPNCKQCKQLQSISKILVNQLTMLAESDYGIGEIRYQMLKGKNHMKETLAVTLPYLISSERPLKKLMLNYEILDILFNTFLSKGKMLDIGVPSLSLLACTLRIKDPINLEKKFNDSIILDYDPTFEGVDDDDIVEFLLDDHSTVVANKDFLCQESEVFSAMFSGSFKESNEKSVRLKNVSKNGLEYLLTLLHSGVNSKVTTIQTFPLTESVQPALDAFLLADRFLVEKVKNSLFSAIVQFHLNANTIDIIYMWSLEDGMGILCVESVAHYLTGRMTNKDRVRIFSSMLQTSYKDQWIDDLKSILQRHFS